MRNEIFKRILSSVVMIILSFYCIIVGSYFFNLMLLVVFLISSYEWHKMSQNKPIQLGLCCLNITLKNEKPSIYASRKMMMKTIKK